MALRGGPTRPGEADAYQPEEVKVGQEAEQRRPALQRNGRRDKGIGRCRDKGIGPHLPFETPEELTGRKRGHTRSSSPERRSKSSGR